LGNVFDVTKGKRYYGTGGGYNFFAGIDGSAAYVTGEFNETGLTDNVDKLTAEQIGGIHGWMHNTYFKSYTYIGKLIGNFYDEDGKETRAMRKVNRMVKEAARIEEEKKKDEERYPRCNTQWSSEGGGTVWCTEDSGGVKRNWVGVPRKYTAKGAKETRCACVQLPVSTDKRFVEYDNCPSQSVT